MTAEYVLSRKFMLTAERQPVIDLIVQVANERNVHIDFHDFERFHPMLLRSLANRTRIPEDEMPHIDVYLSARRDYAYRANLLNEDLKYWGLALTHPVARLPADELKNALINHHLPRIMAVGPYDNKMAKENATAYAIYRGMMNRNATICDINFVWPHMKDFFGGKTFLKECIDACIACDREDLVYEVIADFAK